MLPFLIDERKNATGSDVVQVMARSHSVWTSLPKATHSEKDDPFVYLVQIPRP